MIISPAKKMRVDQEYLAYQDLPRFLKEAERLMGQLRQMDASALQTLWKCNDALARDYPVLYQSLLQVVHNSGERFHTLLSARRSEKR